MIARPGNVLQILHKKKGALTHQDPGGNLLIGMQFGGSCGQVRLSTNFMLSFMVALYMTGCEGNVE